jgi:hypothetical protein
VDRVDAEHQGLVEQAQQGAELGAGGGEGFAVLEAGGLDQLFQRGVGAEDFVEVVGVVAGLECEIAQVRYGETGARRRRLGCGFSHVWPPRSELRFATTDAPASKRGRQLERVGRPGSSGREPAGLAPSRSSRLKRTNEKAADHVR